MTLKPARRVRAQLRGRSHTRGFRSAPIQRLIESPFRAPCQAVGRSTDCTDAHSHRGVGIKPVFFGHQIELDEIARANLARARNTVNGFVIHADAERAWKAVDFGRRGFGSVLSQYAGADFVQFPGCDARPDGGRSFIERLAHDSADSTQFVEFGLGPDGHTA